MNYRLELQKLSLQIEETKDQEERKKLLKQAIDIADMNNDYYEGIDLRYQLIEEEQNVDFRIKLWKQSIQLADSAKDLEESFYLRKELIEEETLSTAKCIDSFPAMTWLLNAVDTYPDRFNEDEVLWQYKWLANSAIDNSNVTYAQIEEVLNDLKIRLERNGYGLGAYYVPKIEWDISRGYIESAIHTIKERDNYGRDGMSDCEACEQNLKIRVKLLAGQIEEALQDMNEMKIKKLTCAEVPFETYTYLTYYLNKYQVGNADEFFNKGLNEIQENAEPNIIEGISRLINYASYYDKEHALLLFEKYANWQLGAEDCALFNISLNFLKLFQQNNILDIKGLSSEFPFYNSNQKYDSHKIYNYYLEQAQKLANKFDARNQTDNFNTLLKKEIEFNQVH